MIPAPAVDAQRVSLRRKAPDGLCDVVGVLVEESQDALTLLPEGCGPVVVPRSEITAARVAPPRVVRPSSSPADLQRVMIGHWPATDRFRLGGWVLRAGAGGTRRANSALAVGDPGGQPGDALDRVDAFYQQRGLRTCVQVPLRPASVRGQGGRADGDAAELVPVLDALGWQAESLRLVLVRDLRRPVELIKNKDLPGLRSTRVRFDWQDEPSSDWVGLWRGGQASGAAASELRDGPATYLSVRDAAQSLAIGRLAVCRGWAEVACVEVRHNVRRRGLGRDVICRLLAHASALGARFAVLQVEHANTAGRALCTAEGFRRHHYLEYRTPPR